MDRRRLAALAGPLLIVAAVLVARRGFLAGGLSDQHPDVLSFWLPRFCFLGESLREGHLPLWNPLLQLGTPYLAEPQSGWLHVPAMALFSTLGCGTALVALITLHPLLAGLGTYWFLRVERLHRVAATAGGLAAAMVLGASSVGVSLPFSGSLAWTPFLLAAASGYGQADRWSRRLAWAALGAFAWTQIAAAHLSHGLVIATGLAAAVLAAHAVRAVRTGESDRARAAALAAGFLALLPLAGLALLVPRLALTPDTSLRDGYAGLTALAGGGPVGNDRPLVDQGVWAAWPLSLGSTPGAYAGAAILLAVPAAFRRTSKRGLAVAFGAAGLVAWLLTLDLVVGTQAIRDLALRLPFGDFWLHNPGRLRVAALVVAPALGAIGIHGMLERPPGVRRALAWLAAGAGAFLALPLLLGASPVRLSVLALGGLAAVPVVALAGGKTWARAALPVVLAVELVAATVYGQLYRGGTIFFGLEDPVSWVDQEGSLVPGPLRSPDVDVGEYLRAGPTVQAMRGEEGRYLTWAPPAAYTVKGYLFSQQEEMWPGLAMGRGMLFDLSDTMGYNPIQLERYWRYVRATNDLPIFYNASVIQLPERRDVDLMGIRWLTVPRGLEPPLPGEILATEGDWNLWEVEDPPPLVEAIDEATLAATSEQALDRMLSPAFDPREEAVLEPLPGSEDVAVLGDPASLPLDDDGDAELEVSSPTPEDVRIQTSSGGRFVLLVRTAYDRRWEATIDGEPVEILPADFLLQGVVVPAGEHEVRLVYRDPTIAVGLVGSGTVWAGLLLAIGTALARERRRATGTPSSSVRDRTPAATGSG